ncbi:MlaC/ttg2D family ABC transporter substrate-binding protein [Azospirillum brasilense]|uniref:ABC transporter substrate-binding protein n=1 Tax=Azospirillum brasilense TaxID=192 RepID=A0A6L3B6Y6_AZOBR|nr:ABC transporter substrate-binding protein [Azospirillum brasilense]KAA0688795.1 ABC transporter substrate-binding protein [Azospirillum brasilense]
MLTRRLFLVCAALLAVSSWAARPAAAQSADPGATAFIQSLGNEAVATFSNKSLSREQAVQRFRGLLYQGFDVAYIGRWVLGRYWNSATPQQHDEYQKLFERLIVNTYADRFVEYSGETFRISGSRVEGEADTMVSTQIVRPNGPPVNVDWRVRKRDTAYKIIDVVVEGVSMGVTQRQEFASVIGQNGGRVEGLLQALRQKVGSAG